ncbi:tRNA (adenosine(37)-N6)-threonylcarbamoyltransferase complex transferase subunit TsaD [Candidatus Parcubacteria bacterium]|nr:MAG: tRNA (adenosine(37)-N6)-threonylcarbamoyltransferase complex transferase subunit TsaD [Candidatus Parcubacteria bacterium]
MKILAIETSCDETALALIKGRNGKVKVEKSVVLSQIQTHAKYGGVVPEVAARKHLEAIFPMLAKELSPGGKEIDIVAVTAGPGLSPALRTGVETAKTLVWLWKKPLLPVNHLVGHIYSAWINKDKQWTSDIPEFPALILLVSGGHTELIFAHSHGQFEKIGETLDDAAGEAFDKVAKMLDLPYPGGPQIANLAKYGDERAFIFPRALLDKRNFDFSFSGLKTSVLYTLRKIENIDKQVKADIAASFQEAVVDVLVRKTIKAAEQLKAKSIILAGGVSANRVLRGRFEMEGKKIQVPVFVPLLSYCGDNAAMIGAAAYYLSADKNNFVSPIELTPDPNLDIV